MENPKVSIIIPSRRFDPMTEKCINECLKLDYDNFEIILSLGVKDTNFKNKKVKIIEAGEVTPSIKRNLAIKQAGGESLAFIDSDAYPEKDWLKNAIKYFEDKSIGLVGGPNLTPKEGNFSERVSGYVLSNFWATGLAYVRYNRTRNQVVSALPSCNYISRKEISPEYNSGYLTAEDIQFCSAINKKGYKILYAGDVVVYHHRRDTLKKHIKQMFIYGRDMGWLSKEDKSINKAYISLLSFFTLGFFMGIILSFFAGWARILFLDLTLVYLILILVTSIHENLKMTLATTFTTILTHFSYGFGFIYSILKKNPKKVKAA